MIRRPPSSTLFPSRRSSDLIEQPVAARLDVSAVLNVVWRPEALSGRIITSVEQSVECFKHDSSVLVFQTLFHGDRKSTRLNSSHSSISYAVFCLKKKNKKHN